MTKSSRQPRDYFALDLPSASTFVSPSASTTGRAFAKSKIRSWACYALTYDLQYMQTDRLAVEKSLGKSQILYTYQHLSYGIQVPVLKIWHSRRLDDLDPPCIHMPVQIASFQSMRRLIRACIIEPGLDLEPLPHILVRDAELWRISNLQPFPSINHLESSLVVEFLVGSHRC